MKHIVVVAAILLDKNQILCVQRGISALKYISQKFEFPGGKVEIGETFEQALVREIKEELNLDIDVDRQFLTVDHQYPDFRITMHSYICCSQNVEMLRLTEHICHLWLPISELSNLDWAEADIPIVERLKMECHGR